MDNSGLGREVKYGLGVEATAGTGVAPTGWINQLKFELNPVSEYATNNSSWGNIFRSNNSALTNKHAAGTLEAKLTADFAGNILLGAFGAASTAQNADASEDVFDTTFNIGTTINGRTFTLVRQDKVDTMAHALARFGQWQLSVKLDDYITYTADVLAKVGESTTASPAYVEETEFVAKHFHVKTASNLAGITGATNIATVESFDLTVNPNLEIDKEAGNVNPYSFTSRGFEASFEMTKRYLDSTYRDAYENGTPLAMQLSIENTDVTIGTSAHPKLVVTAPRAYITDYARSEDLDAPVSETFTGTIHFSPSDAYALRAVLTNLTDSYV